MVGMMVGIDLLQRHTMPSLLLAAGCVRYWPLGGVLYHSTVVLTSKGCLHGRDSLRSVPPAELGVEPLSASPLPLEAVNDRSKEIKF